MRGFLLDTSVLSLFAPDRPSVPMPLQQWLVKQGGVGKLFTSTITVLEIRRGIAKLKRAGSGERAIRLEGWLASMLVEFEQNIVPIDSAIALVAGEMEDAAIAAGRSPGLADVLIAATATVLDLTVATSNVRHFEALGIPILDPLNSPLPS